ncbi:unnamed protein product, partial [Allacma fusca]
LQKNTGFPKSYLVDPNGREDFRDPSEKIKGGGQTKKENAFGSSAGCPLGRH